LALGLSYLAFKPQKKCSARSAALGYTYAYMKSALLLYPNQLYALEFLPKVQRVYMVEEPLVFGTDQEFGLGFHKQKLVLLRASMRRYAEEVLWPAGYEVEYIECAPETVTDTALVKAAFDGASEICVFDPVDDVLSKRLAAAARALEVHVPLKVLENPNFYLHRADIDTYFSGKQKHLFADFYQYMRERFDVLIDANYKPFGGKWSFDSENRKKLPKTVELPGIASFGDNAYVKEAMEYVQNRFPNNIGELETFLWPTNRSEALLWMHDFFTHRLESFGAYEDAIDSRGVWLFHSALSPVLNIGLISPHDVIEGVLEHCAKTKKEIPLASLEGFVRQVIGWREYIRAMYVLHGSQMRTKNFLANKRRLTTAWYDGTTGLLPFDDVVHKARKFAYAHHIERLMVAGNIMLLSEINPDDVYAWFMTFFIDAYDWVMVPNIYGMSQYADGGMMTTKPYMSGSNYILSMSNYPKAHWCDVWDGLFWRFVDTHRLWLKKNPRLGGVLISRLDTMSQDRRRIIGYRAQDFLDEYTSTQ
jgi:deoxyribodipyrimidine photolyase-related protein